VGRAIQINTICRADAKKQAPSGYMLRKKVGGFIAYESRLDIPSKAKNLKKREYPYYLSEEDKKRFIENMREEEPIADNKYFPFKTKEAYLKSITKRITK
jgi:hypothetical protein